MARISYNPQVVSASRPLRIVPTEYKEPAERTAALGFASSILNGNTTEGGLRSLTYKSIYALKLTEELDMVRKLVVAEEGQLLRISDTDVITDARLDILRKELSELEKPNTTSRTDEKILDFNLRLDTELENSKQISAAYNDELKKYYQGLFPKMVISYDDEAYKLHSLKVGVEVQKMEDVEGFDGSIYAQKAIQHKREEEEQRQREEDERIQREEEEQRQKELAEIEAAHAMEEDEDVLFGMDTYEESLPTMSMDITMQ